MPLSENKAKWHFVTITYRLLWDAQKDCDAASYWSGIRRCRCHAVGSNEFPNPNLGKCLSDSPDRCWGAGLAEAVYCWNLHRWIVTLTEVAHRNKVCAPPGIVDPMNTYSQPQSANWRRHTMEKKTNIFVYLNFLNRILTEFIWYK